jgi:hypothetical protein
MAITMCACAVCAIVSCFTMCACAVCTHDDGAQEETAKRPSTRKKRKFDVVRDFLGVQAPPLFNPTPYVFDSSALADGDGALASMPPPLPTGPAGADAASSCLPSSSFSTLG